MADAAADKPSLRAGGRVSVPGPLPDHVREGGTRKVRERVYGTVRIALASKVWSVQWDDPDAAELLSSAKPAPLLVHQGLQSG